MYYVTKEFKFCAAHKLREYEGACKRMHGHNYKVHVTLRGIDLDKAGMLLDFGDLKRICQKEIVDRYDHYDMNEIEPFNEMNATAENMVYRFFLILDEKISELPEAKERGFELYSVKVWETDSSFAEWRRE